MKKGRPAHTLSVLVAVEHRADVLAGVFRETSTLGLREQAVAKVALQRTDAAVDVGSWRIRVKVAWHEGRVVNVQPEYEDVVAAARALGQPVKVVLASAVAQAAPLWTTEPPSQH